MKIRTSIVTASILRDHCNVCDDLIEQINKIPTKANTICLYVEQENMQKAFQVLKEFMSKSENYHKDSFEYALREIEYFANCNI